MVELAVIVAVPPVPQKGAWLFDKVINGAVVEIALIGIRALEQVPPNVSAATK